MLEVAFDESASQFIVTSHRCGSVRVSYPRKVQRYGAVSDTEFLVVDEDGTEERFSDDGFKLG